MAPAAAPVAPAGAPAEVARAVRNAAVLGSSLVVTWGVALAVRLFLPRLLGPELFGRLTFADAFAGTAFVLLGLGVDLYIRKEIPVRPAHASDFFGGVLLLRAALALVVLLGMALVLAATHRPSEVTTAALAFGVAQVLLNTNESLAALLHAQGTVGGLSVANVVAKLLWAAGIAGAVLLRAPLAGFAVAMIASEAAKSAQLLRLARTHLGLRFEMDVRATGAVLLAALPFNLNTMAHTAYARVDVSLLAVLTNDDLAVGWYGAASALAGLTLLATPLITWVLMPLLARAAARSEGELFAATRQALELILSLAIPASLLLALGADTWIRLVFGAAFAPAALSLRLLAPMFVMTYVAAVSAVTLMLLDRGWSVTAISLGGLVLNPALNVALIPAARTLLGRAGGGAGCALSITITEAAVTGAMLVRLGGRTFDRGSVSRLGRALLAAVAVAALDHGLRALGGARLLVDAVAYLLLAVALGALRPAELLNLVRTRVESHGLQD